MFLELYYVLSSEFGFVCLFVFQHFPCVSMLNPYTALLVYSNNNLMSQMRNQGMDAFTKIINKWLSWDLDSAILTLEPLLNFQAILKMLIAYAGLQIGVRVRCVLES